MVRSVPWWILRYDPNVAKLWLTSTFVSSTFSSLKLKENKKWLFATNATAQPDAWIILTGWHFTFNIAKFQLNRMKVSGCLWGGFYHSKVGWVRGGRGRNDHRGRERASWTCTNRSHEWKLHNTVVSLSWDYLNTKVYSTLLNVFSKTAWWI